MYQAARYLHAADHGLVVEFGDAIAPEIAAKVRSLTYAIERAGLPGVKECIPTYRSVLVVFDPEQVEPEWLEARVRELESHLESVELPPPALVEVPTAYGGEFGPDLPDVAAHTGLSPEEVIRLHSSVNYLVYMLGFTVGYPYLGGMPEQLATPRLKNPRGCVPAGSVGIAGPQTGIYPVDSPGGWRIIGRTPLKLYDPSRNPPVLFRPGDYLKFVPISLSEFEEIRRQVEEGTYKVKGLDLQVGSTHLSVEQEGEQGNRFDGLEVLEPGLHTTIQDLGRFGYQKYGMPPSGVMDRFSAMMANALVGNNLGQAVLEVTLAGPRLKALRDLWVAVTGAEFHPQVNGKPVSQWETLHLREGDELHLGSASTGCRAYIAVKGGFAVPPVLGSRSTYVKGAIGGIQGRRLQRGDRLPCYQAVSTSQRALRLPESFRPVFGGECTVRAVPGPQDDYFTQEGLEAFFSQPYTVTPQSDRMGIRLSGAPIKHKGKSDIISDGIAWGSVQVPGDQQPIVLLADRQTTGGYPKIATTIWADLDLLGQLRPGDKLRFEKVDVATAYHLAKERSARIKKAIEAMSSPKTRTFIMRVNGVEHRVSVEEL
ncbi:MAG: 5-oxoprolinase subunit PxpB [Bacillota bacterium]